MDCGKEILAIETDADTVVSGTLVKDSDDSGESAATSVSRGQEFAQIARSQKFNELLHAFPIDMVASDGKTSHRHVRFQTLAVRLRCRRRWNANIRSQGNHSRNSDCRRLKNRPPDDRGTERPTLLHPNSVGHMIYAYPRKRIRCARRRLSSGIYFGRALGPD